MKDERLIKRSLGLCYDLFPLHYKTGQRPYHFAFLFKKSTFVSFGINGYKQDAKILQLGNRFNIAKYKKYKYPHAETDAISKAWGKTYLDNRCSIVILRLNKFGKLQNSKPCQDCQVILDSLSITNVWWSDKNGKITNGQDFFEYN